MLRPRPYQREECSSGTRHDPRCLMRAFTIVSDQDSRFGLEDLRGSPALQSQGTHDGHFHYVLPTPTIACYLVFDLWSPVILLPFSRRGLLCAAASCCCFTYEPRDGNLTLFVCRYVYTMQNFASLRRKDKLESATRGVGDARRDCERGENLKAPGRLLDDRRDVKWRRMKLVH